MASLFTSQTPAVPNADNANAIHVGTYFVPAVDGTVTKARWYPPTTSQSGVKAALFRTSDSAKIGADVTFPGSIAGPGWVEVDFAAPVPVLEGVQYAIVVRTPRFYSATTGGASPWPLTNGDLSTPSNAGRFNDSENADVQFPTDAFNNGCYFADVVFTTGAEPAEGVAAVGIDLAVAASGGADAEGASAAGLGLAVAASGAARAEGVVALSLPLSVAASGERDSLGAATLGLNLAVAASGERDSLGAVALGLNLAVAATGSNGDVGCPVPSWPFPLVSVGTSWTPRAVRSFPGGDCS